MRMWNIPTPMLCRKHLMGEHVEMHMFTGTLNKGSDLKGFIYGDMVEVHNIKKRHDELAEEMIKRGYKHQSPLEESPNTFKAGVVDVDKNIYRLYQRCSECKILITKYLKEQQ